jgi:hypothetical protein
MSALTMETKLELLEQKFVQLELNYTKIETHYLKLQQQYTQVLKELAEAQNDIEKLKAADFDVSPQEVYYQKLLEQRFPGAGHRTLTTKAGSTIITDVTSPDTWNPSEHDGMPSHHIEIKRTNGYKEIISQLEMAQAVLPRDLLIGALFVNPSIKKLKDIFELFHPHRIKLCYFDHHDQLWWFDGKEKRPFKEMWIQVPMSSTVLAAKCVFDLARDQLLTKDQYANLNKDEYYDTFVKWLSKTVPLELNKRAESDTKFKENILKGIDKSLTGKALNFNGRRYTYRGITSSGWKGWRLKEA